MRRLPAVGCRENNRGKYGLTAAQPDSASMKIAPENWRGQYWLPRARRSRSAWRRRRETHSRIPYPNAKPTIRAIAISGIDQLENWNVTIESHLTYMNLTVSARGQKQKP